MLNECTITLAASILYKNWQRPGALCNVTVEEFKQCKLVTRAEECVYVLAVREHKTAQEGYARLVQQPTDHSRILQYKATVRRLLDLKGSLPQLFLLSGGRPLSNLSSRVKKLGLKYGLCLPTATRVRKIGATSVALNLGDTGEAHLVTRQLSHSAATDSQYYQAIVGDKHAAQAFESMEQLRTMRGVGKNTSDSPVVASSETQLQKRRSFSLQETELVCGHFAKSLKLRVTPSLAECKRFVEQYGVQRSPKNIQDKVKNLNKQQGK